MAPVDNIGWEDFTWKSKRGTPARGDGGGYAPSTSYQNKAQRSIDRMFKGLYKFYENDPEATSTEKVIDEIRFALSALCHCNELNVPENLQDLEEKLSGLVVSINDRSKSPGERQQMRDELRYVTKRMLDELIDLRDAQFYNYLHKTPLKDDHPAMPGPTGSPPKAAQRRTPSPAQSPSQQRARDQRQAHTRQQSPTPEDSEQQPMSQRQLFPPDTPPGRPSQAQMSQRQLYPLQKMPPSPRTQGPLPRLATENLEWLDQTQLGLGTLTPSDTQQKFMSQQAYLQQQDEYKQRGMWTQQLSLAEQQAWDTQGAYADQELHTQRQQTYAQKQAIDSQHLPQRAQAFMKSMPSRDNQERDAAFQQIYYAQHQMYQPVWPQKGTRHNPDHGAPETDYASQFQEIAAHMSERVDERPKYIGYDHTWGIDRFERPDQYADYTHFEDADYLAKQLFVADFHKKVKEQWQQDIAQLQQDQAQGQRIGESLHLPQWLQHLKQQGEQVYMGYQPSDPPRDPRSFNPVIGSRRPSQQ